MLFKYQYSYRWEKYRGSLMHRCIVAALVLSARVACGFLTDGQFVKKIIENLQVKYMKNHIM